jgi:hypothetical protein
MLSKGLFSEWFGLYNPSEIKVDVVSSSIVWFTYYRCVPNANREREVVWLNPLDKLKGITLEEKANREIDKLIQKLEKKNQQIKSMREMEKRIGG